MEQSKLVWRFCLVVFVSLPLLGTFLLYYYSYEVVTAWIFNTYGQPEKLEKFRSTLLSKDRFEIFRICSALLTGLFLIITLRCWNRHYKVRLAWKVAGLYLTVKLSKIIQLWQGLPAYERYLTVVLFLLLFGLRLYFLFQVPFHIDERFTYLYFVSKGLGVSMAYYPNPNNHIFFTLLCNIAAAFIDDPWLVMKLPAFLLGLLLFVLYWAVMRCFFEFYTAFLATVFFSCSAPVWYYGLQGRGYTLLMICMLTAISSIFSILKAKRPVTGPSFWLWLSCTLGLYTIPVFIYPFAGIITFAGLFLLIERKRAGLRRLLMSCLLIVISTLILYMPVFIFNGWQAVSGNGWVAPLSWRTFSDALPGHLLSLAENMWGYLPLGQWLMLLILLYSLICMFGKNTPHQAKQWMALFCCCLALAIILCIVQRVLLFQRLIIYFSIFQYLILAMIIIKLLVVVVHKPLYRLGTVSVISILYVIFNFSALYTDTAPEKFDLYDSFDNTADLLYRNNADDIFVNMYEYGLCIRFQYETHNKAVRITSQQAAGKTDFQYMVIHKEYPVPAQIQLSVYQPIYSDTEAVVYKLMDKQ